MELEWLLNCSICISISLLLSITYVSSLYVWKSSFHRNRPDVVKKRFISVVLMLFISPCFLYVGINKDVLSKTTLLNLLGLRSEGICQAIFMPLFLTMILFLGPLSLQVSDDLFKLYAEPMHWLANFKNLLWLRNCLVAPLSEEFTFRSCLVPLWLQYFSPSTVIFIVPLFFGIAHLHHFMELIKTGTKLKTALAISCFQMLFTTIFGMYSTFIFIRTGHFISTFVVHAFCNHMGFPNLEEVLYFKGVKRIFVCFIFIMGFVMWYFLLFPLTQPSWYYNDILWY